MLSFAAYAALVAAFVFAARQAGDAAAPKTASAEKMLEAGSACFVLQYAEINERHALADLPSIASVSLNACSADARSQGNTVVKQNEKEQV